MKTLKTDRQGRSVNMGNANQHLQQSELSSKYGKNRISRSALKCPQCDVVVDWGNERVCSNGHSIRSVAGIPLCFSPESYLEKHTADPSYELVHSIGIAEFLNAECETFDSAINLFFDTRELELKAKLTRERKLYAQRKVPQYSQSIVDASALLSRIGLAFPSRNRFHLDIGCGMGFELAASSRSYFGANVIGLDLSPHYLVLAQKLLAEHGLRDVPLFCADIRDGLPIPFDVYDIGFISMDGVLEHIKDASKFLETLSKIESDPLVIYLTVPYRWTWQRESHFDLRGVGWLPRFLQDRYIAWRLGVASIAHVELYSKTSLRRLLKRYFYLSWIIIERNSNDPRKSHYLKCTIYRSKNAINKSLFYIVISIIGRNYIGIRIGRLLLRIPVIGPLIKTSLKKLG